VRAIKFAMLQEQRVTLEAMPANESRVFKALQTFILDVLDVMDMEEEEGKDEGILTLSCYFNGPLNTLGSSNVVMALPAEPEPVAPKPPSKAEQAGAFAVKILKEVFRLENKGKMAEAQALRKIIPVGKVIGERAINQTAQDFEQRLFKVGGLGTVEAVLKKVLWFSLRPCSKRFSTAPSCARYMCHIWK